MFGTREQVQNEIYHHCDILLGLQSENGSIPIHVIPTMPLPAEESDLARQALVGRSLALHAQEDDRVVESVRQLFSYIDTKIASRDIEESHITKAMLTYIYIYKSHALLSLGDIQGARDTIAQLESVYSGKLENDPLRLTLYYTLSERLSRLNVIPIPREHIAYLSEVLVFLFLTSAQHYPFFTFAEMITSSEYTKNAHFKSHIDAYIGAAKQSNALFGTSIEATFSSPNAKMFEVFCADSTFELSELFRLYEALMGRSLETRDTHLPLIPQASKLISNGVYDAYCCTDTHAHILVGLDYLKKRI
jgi:hypothetical protein